MSGISFADPPAHLARQIGAMSIDAVLANAKTPRSTVAIFPITPPPELELEHTAKDLVHAARLPVSPDARPLVAVIGVGYVGEHLVETFAREYDTLGFDVSDKRLQLLQQTSFGSNPRICLTSNTKDLDEATHFLISVPTLLLPDNSIDASYLKKALETVAAHARQGCTVVVESSVAVGMTRELLGPLAKARGFYAGMSPERVDPGRVEPPAYDIPKVISGLDDVVPGSLDSITRLYSRVFNRVVPVSSPEVAEMTKLYENCQRMMCIAYANEMADACKPHNIDPYEVCSAAASKPFGYMPYLPGVGVGGHCIPVNPYYLLSNSSFPLLQHASEIMKKRPADIASRAVKKLLHSRRSSYDSAVGLKHDKPSVLVVGVGFKAGQSVLSNSPGLDLLKHLSASGEIAVSFADKMVSQEAVSLASRLPDEDWTEDRLEKFDMIIVTMLQAGMDFSVLDDIQGPEVEWWCRR